jgi:hypothetical protein
VAAGAVLIGAVVTPAVASWATPSSHAADPGPAEALRPPSASPGAGAGAVAGHSAGDTAPLSTSITAVRRQAARAAAERAARRHRREHHATVTVLYQNPLRDVTGLMLERVDQGVDFAGSGPVFAIGDGIVTGATGDSGGWPGGGWITYQLTDGPATGEVVYVAEDVTPAVVVGQRVTPSTVVGNMFLGGDGIETGWAMLDSATAESQLAEAGGISGAGPFPTAIGVNFDQLLMATGVPAAPNEADAPSGLVPSRYPADWATALAR